jgi:hypothetical protein
MSFPFALLSTAISSALRGLKRSLCLESPAKVHYCPNEAHWNLFAPHLSGSDPSQSLWSLHMWLEQGGYGNCCGALLVAGPDRGSSRRACHQIPDELRAAHCRLHSHGGAHGLAAITTLAIPQALPLRNLPKAPGLLILCCRQDDIDPCPDAPCTIDETVALAKPKDFPDNVVNMHMDNKKWVKAISNRSLQD